jgi:hypothetical protein
VAINFAGMYTKYLTDRGQRLAFIETHKAMENKKESEKEYQKTQRLLDSSKNFNSFSCSFLSTCDDILMYLAFPLLTYFPFISFPFCVVTVKTKKVEKTLWKFHEKK